MQSDGAEYAGSALDTVWWHARGPAPAAHPTLDGRIETDVAVVGAGIAGLSTALHLAEAGVSVAIAEAGIHGCGASGRNTGFVVPALNASLGPAQIVEALGPEQGRRLTDLVVDSGRTLFDIIRRHAIDCDGAQSGFIQAAPFRRQWDGLRRRADEWSHAGADIALFDAPSTQARTGADGYVGAIEFRTGGTIDPLGYTRGLARAAVAAGAKLFERSPVVATHRHGDRWRVMTARGEILASKLVIATNGIWGPARRAVLPVAVHQIATAPLSPAARGSILPGGGCVTDMRRDSAAFRLSSDARLLGGGIAALPWGAGARLPPFFKRRFERLLPGRGIPDAEHVWTGRIAVTPGFVPRLYEPAPDCFAPIWCNGRGNALASALGAELARALAKDDFRAFPLPREKPAEIPFHALAALGPRFWLPWARLRDAYDARRN